jgi:hypothetical protein
VAKNLAAKTIGPPIPASVAKATATTIGAFVAKNLAAKTIAPPIPASVAKATTIRAFVAKNLASDSYSLLRFFINPSATHDFTKNKFGLGY